MSVLSIPYVAGVIDARGHISFNERHNHVQPRVRITTKRTELLSYLASVTNTKVITDERGYVRRPCSNHCGLKHQHVVRQSSVWQVDSSRAVIVLWNIKEYIVCQTAEVETALTVGLKVWPPRRGNTIDKMKLLGWKIPD